MNSIQTIDRAIDVLQAFSAGNTSLTIEEISAIAHLPKNTVYRILYTLARRGLVQFDATSLTYQPGLRLLEFSMLKSSTLTYGKRRSRSWMSFTFERSKPS